MTNKEEPSKYHTVQAERDLEANWEVDLAKKLEDYLLKICSGEITGNEEDNSVNFAEAALLLQGSVQVYSRKVEYLHNLVLHALDFLSQKRQQEQAEDASGQHEQCGFHAVSDEENDRFWVSDDIPVEPRNSLDTSTSKDSSFYHFVKPPANLVVLEGDCLDTGGNDGELESYLLATSDLYQDFILLDPCDAVAINDYLRVDDAGKGQNGASRGSSVHKTFLSPTRRSGGTAHKSSLGKDRDAHLMQSPMAGCGFGVNDCKMGPDRPVCDDFEDNINEFDMGDRFSEPGNPEDSDDDEDDPWKLLNPHESGNLKVKPFKKVKAFRRNGVKSAKQISITTLFPLARMHCTINPDLTEIWEIRKSKLGRCENLQSPPLYEKLRESLTNGGHNIPDPSGSSENDNEDNIYNAGIPDFGWPDDEMPEATHMDEDLPHVHEKHDDGSSHFGPNDDYEHVDPSSQASLEDLCRSHLDALLANIAETEKQTELAARVSTWKQKIEQNLEEQDSQPPFDIHAYGESIVHKLSLEAADSENTMSFTDVVYGQEKHDVARTFSALLQLVNNGEVDLDRSRAYGESYCYTAVNPFHVRLLVHKKKQEGIQINLSKKRVKSPIRKGSPKVGKNGGIRCTPEGKRRRRSRLVGAVDLHSAG